MHNLASAQCTINFLYTYLYNMTIEAHLYLIQVGHNPLSSLDSTAICT